jgi:hypothetical protein
MLQNAYLKCFQMFQGMCQMFYMDVAVVVFGCATCCFYIILEFCIYRDGYARMLQEFVQTHVASVFSRCCICCNGYVANVCSKCFICFKCTLQLFYLSVVKVDLDVALLSEKERASAGAMAASMWGGGASRATPMWKRHGSHRSDVEEVGAKWCGRDGQDAGVEEMRLSHPDGMS